MRGSREIGPRIIAKAYRVVFKVSRVRTLAGRYVGKSPTVRQDIVLRFGIRKRIRITDR